MTATAGTVTAADCVAMTWTKTWLPIGTGSQGVLGLDDRRCHPAHRQTKWR